MTRSAVALVVFAAVLINVSAVAGVAAFACAGLIAQRRQSPSIPVARGMLFEPQSIEMTTTERPKPIVRHVDFVPEKVDPETMAVALMAWLQDSEGRCGEIRASVLMLIWREMCLQNGWLDSNWRETASAFRRLIGQPKQEWARHDGRSVVVYNVPEREQIALPNAVDPATPKLVSARVVHLRKKAA